jgi:hypothetical protein
MNLNETHPKLRQSNGEVQVIFVIGGYLACTDLDGTIQHHGNNLQNGGQQQTGLGGQ